MTFDELHFQSTQSCNDHPEPLIPSRPVAREVIHTEKHSYRLRKILGSGGFGEVHLAERFDEDEECGIPRLVAVKLHFLDPGRGETALRRELSAMSSLVHPRIPRLYDWSLEKDCPLMVIRYYGRGGLSRPSGLPLEAQTVWRLLKDVLGALVAAHRASLLHLDIKPGNILQDDDGGFVLGDFGLAQALLASASTVGFARGTAGYRSPEQDRLLEDQIDARTDLYGLGACAWSLLAGVDLASEERYRLPRPEEGYGLPPLSRFAASCPPKLEEIVMALLLTDRKNRPGSAAEVLAWVEGKHDPSDGRTTLPGSLGSTSVPSQDVMEVLGSLLDPVWVEIASTPEFRSAVEFHPAGTVLGIEGEPGHRAFVLLRGRIGIWHGDQLLTIEDRQCNIIGEVAALTGSPRTASIKADGPVWVAALNAAELETLAARHPALAVRLMKLLADRLLREARNRTV